MNYNFTAFGHAVADYIDNEYNADAFGKLSEDEKNTIYQIMISHYDGDGCVSNAANYIIDYLRRSRQWVADNIS